MIIGVHTPEFAFEHVTSNVRAAVKRLGISYPVMQDNRYKTWDNYANQYWPAEYLIDKQGHVRHTHFGEGEYDQTESLIRRLLGDNGAHARADRRRDADRAADAGELPRLRAPRELRRHEPRPRQVRAVHVPELAPREHARVRRLVARRRAGDHAREGCAAAAAVRGVERLPRRSAATAPSRRS